MILLRLKSLTFVLLALSSACVTSAVAQIQLRVTVMNFKERGGTVRVGLFDNPNDFLKKGVDGRVAAYHADSVTVVFENLEPGEYAVSVFHDQNNNGKLDTNAVGIPKEGFAFGNNAMGLFGPPSFDNAKVILEDTHVTQVLKLKHF